MCRSLAVRALSLVLLSLPLAASDAQTEQRTLRGARVAIYNLAGRLRAVAGTGDAVVVEVTRVGPDASQLKIETGAIRDRETLRIVYPGERIVYRDSRGRARINVREDGTFNDAGPDIRWDRDRVDIRPYGPGLDAHADLLVRVPKGQRIELKLAVGRIDVSNLEGDVMVDVNAAEVDVNGVKGLLTLDTGSGRVSVTDVTGDVNVDAGSGGITLDKVKGNSLRLDSGSGGVQGTDIEVRQFEADVGSGGLRMYRVRAPEVNVETGSGGMHIELLSEVTRINAETGSGGVTIRAPASLGAEVEVETGSGGFQSDFEITTRRVSRNHVEGRIGDGRARIRIEAGSGTVRLLKSTAQ